MNGGPRAGMRKRSTAGGSRSGPSRVRGSLGPCPPRPPEPGGAAAQGGDQNPPPRRPLSPATFSYSLSLGCSLPRAARSLTPFGLLRVFSVVIPFLYVGTQISKNFAALLEEHDIFVPEDDDDDD
uniref:Essential MCU regulator, mitochondrial n=1 Tax=Serinus canaria TaxID=9135 RepID=A0A8C9UAK8_SERCA